MAEQSPKPAAVDYATPVRPLTGHACHAVWCGATPAKQIRSASWAYWRREGKPAGEAMALMHADLAAEKIRFPAHYPDANKDFSDYGEDRVRFIERPEALGMRLVGLAHEAAPANYAYLRPAVGHTGWYLDHHQCETVVGVVYQISGKGGRARYLVGYADPWNCDKDGRGPALLSLSPIVGDQIEFDCEFDPVLREAARRADGIAERMAEAERNYRKAYEAGRSAREAGQVMRDTAARYVRALRAMRTVIRNRHRIGCRDARLITRSQIEQVRGLIHDLKAARREFRTVLKVGQGHAFSNSDAWRDGYAEG